MILSAFSQQIYDYVTGFLPWSYTDTVNGSSVDVIKVADGLRVIVTDKGLDGKGYREITVNVPQTEVKTLLKKS